VIHMRARRLLGDYLEGDLDLARRARVDAHLAECEECAREVRELRQTVSMLRGLPVEAPPALADAVMARIAAGEARPSRWVRATRHFGESGGGWALAAGFAALLIVVTLEPVPLGDPRGDFSMPVQVGSPVVVRVQPAASQSVPGRYGSARHTAAFAGAAAPAAVGALDDEVERLLRARDPESLVLLMTNPSRGQRTALRRGDARAERRLHSADETR